MFRFLILLAIYRVFPYKITLAICADVGIITSPLIKREKRKCLLKNWSGTAATDMWNATSTTTLPLYPDGSIDYDGVMSLENGRTFRPI